MGGWGNRYVGHTTCSPSCRTYRQCSAYSMRTRVGLVGCVSRWLGPCVSLCEATHVWLWCMVVPALMSSRLCCVPDCCQRRQPPRRKALVSARAENYGKQQVPAFLRLL